MGEKTKSKSSGEDFHGEDGRLGIGTNETGETELLK